MVTPTLLISGIESSWPTAAASSFFLLHDGSKISITAAQMATVMLSLHSKQPKRGMVSCENGYIEVMEYPRAWEAKVTYTDTGKTETVAAGENVDALAYELQDMESAISGDGDMYLEYTKDVMDMMTEFRRSWGFTYPEEE